MLEKIFNHLHQSNSDIEAFLITNLVNVRYLSGFTGSAGAILLLKDKKIFVTDSRYTQQAEQQCHNFEIVTRTQSLAQEINALLQQYHIKFVAFEEQVMTVAELKAYDNQERQWIGVNNIIEYFRMFKTPEELVLIKKAIEISENTYHHILKWIKPGMTELQVANEMEMHMRQQGASSTSFDTIVASGWRGALPHGVASDKIINSGDMITLDFGCFYQGYTSDITRTFAIGEPDEKLIEIYNLVRRSNEYALANMKVGMTAKEIDALTRDMIVEAGYGDYYGHSAGHAIGLDVHESPVLGYGNTAIIEEHMVLTIEPGIYIPNLGGIRIEDDVVMTKNGAKVLTTLTKELIILPSNK